MAMSLTLNNLALTVLSILAIYLDLTRRKIPNLLTLPFMLTGLVYHIWLSGFGGLWFALVGLLVGLGLLLFPFAVGGVGGGDVKYLGAVGALQGASFVLVAFLVGALLGGVLSLGYLLVKGRLGATLRRLGSIVFHPLFRMLGLSFKAGLFFKAAAWFSLPAAREEEKLYLPYGVPIAIGALLAMSGLVHGYMPGLIFWQ